MVLISARPRHCFLARNQHAMPHNSAKFMKHMWLWYLKIGYPIPYIYIIYMYIINTYVYILYIYCIYTLKIYIYYYIYNPSHGLSKHLKQMASYWVRYRYYVQPRLHHYNADFAASSEQLAEWDTVQFLVGGDWNHGILMGYHGVFNGI